MFNEVNNRFPSLPFSLRALEDEKQVRVVAPEALQQQLVALLACVFYAAQHTPPTLQNSEWKGALYVYTAAAAAAVRVLFDSV